MSVVNEPVVPDVRDDAPRRRRRARVTAPLAHRPRGRRGARGVRAAAAGPAPLPGPADGRGLHARLPGAGAAGAIPNRDFLHLYGPGSLWVLAGVFKVFGVSLLSERFFGLLQQLGDRVRDLLPGPARGAASLAVVRPLVRRCLIIMPPFGLTALAWVGGVASGLVARCGLAAGVAGARRHRRQTRRALGAARRGPPGRRGAAFRLDLVVAVGPRAFGSLRVAPGPHGPSAAPHRVRASACAPYVVQLATAGPGPRGPGHGARPGVPPPRRAACRSRRRGTTSTASCRRPAGLRNIGWPLPAPRRPHQLVPLVLPAARVAIVRAVARLAGASAGRPARYRARALFIVGLFGARHPPAGAAAGRLRPLRVGELRRRSRFVPIAIYELALPRRATRRAARRRRRWRSRWRRSCCSWRS